MNPEYLKCVRCHHPNKRAEAAITELELRLKLEEDQVQVWKDGVRELCEEMKPWHEKFFDRIFR